MKIIQLSKNWAVKVDGVNNQLMTWVDAHTNDKGKVVEEHWHGLASYHPTVEAAIRRAITVETDIGSEKELISLHEYCDRIMKNCEEMTSNLEVKEV